MKKAFLIRVTPLIVIFVIAVISLSTIGRVKAALQSSPLPELNLFAPQANTITQTSPTICPSSGCAAGQRINFQAAFNDSPLYTAGPNTQVCVYVPAAGSAGNTPWADPASFTISTSGLSGTAYTAGETTSVCTNNLPLNFAYLGGAYASLPTSVTSDTINFAFRLHRLATISADITTPLTVKIFQVNSIGSSWTGTALPPKTITVAAANSPAYVANDAASCGSQTPCYINSGDDLINGTGTGLKDAIDALPAPANISILGSYAIKANAVNINQADIIQGLNNSSLTSTDQTCTNAMLLVTAGATIQNLNITDGPCTNSGRDLISINSTTNVTIASNNLMNGKNAITIADNTGSVLVQYNQIQGNLGYAVLRAAGTGSGAIQAKANNIVGNLGTVQVDCNNKGQVDHNFWGKGKTISMSVANCTASDSKRLGALILTNASKPGVDAQRVTITATKTELNTALNPGVPMGLAVSTTGSPFDMYVINHGSSSNDSIPFYGFGTDYLIACSNFFDLFLAGDAVGTPTNLTLSFKYDMNATCTASVEGNPASLPLYWFDPTSNLTNGWAMTANTGPAVVLEPATKELTTTLTSSGRPNLSTDLNYTPIGVGLPNLVKILRFNVTASIGQALIQWETAYENQLSGYYVIRSLQSNGAYSRTSNLIPAKGNSTIGGTYFFQDTFLDFGTTYYYKLEYVDASGNAIGYFGPVAGITATATPTITPTFTVTLTPTITPTFTRTITPTPSRTWTPYVYYTYTPYQYITYTPYRIPTWTSVPYRSSTPFASATSLFALTSLANLSETPVGTIYLPTSNGTVATLSPGTQSTEGYPHPQTSETILANGTSQYTKDPNSKPGTPDKNGTQAKTQSPTPSGSSSGSKTSIWVSLISGGILGILVIGFAGWFYFQQKLPK